MVRIDINNCISQWNFLASTITVSAQSGTPPVPFFYFTLTRQFAAAGRTTSQFLELPIFALSKNIHEWRRLCLAMETLSL
ncbi:hypothetical protein BsWGS_22489 [Bradybaena similaris]